MKTNKQAADAFASEVSRAKELLALLAAHLDNHMDVDAEAVNWGHVGNAQRVNRDLSNIAQYLNLEPARD